MEDKEEQKRRIECVYCKKFFDCKQEVKEDCICFEERENDERQEESV